MSRAFWQSKLASAAVFAVSGLIIVLIWLRRWGGPVYIPIVASALMLGIALAFGRLVGNMVASNVNVKLLGYLHVELDPDKFIAAYEGVPAKLKAGSVDQSVASAYLADGYAAQGRFQKALDTLRLPEREDKRHVALQGSVLQKRCSYHLFAGDVPAAKETLAQLGDLIQEADKDPQLDPRLSENLKTSQRILQNRLSALGNKQVDESFLLTKINSASYTLLRLELWQALAIWALREEDGEKSKKYLSKLVQEGGKTFFASWARERLD